MRRFSLITTICLAGLFCLLLFIQALWVKSAYEIANKEIKSSFQETVNQKELLLSHVQKVKNQFYKQEIDHTFLSKSESVWRAFFDSLLLERKLNSADYEFDIKQQASLTNEPTLSWIKSKYFDKKLNHTDYTAVQTILFSNFKKDIFSYQTQISTYKLTLIYKMPKPYIVKKIWAILVGAAISIILLILTMITYIISIKKQVRLNKMKTDFFNGMTHELNTPITVIQLAADFIIKKNKGTDSFFSETMQIILQETRRMSDIVKSILATARLQQQKFELKIDLVDIVEIMVEVLEHYKFHLQSIDHCITFNKPKEEIEILGDRFHLFHILSNIIDNSIKYREVVRKLEMEINITQDDSFVYVYVKDNSIGIEEDEINKVFDSFVRGSSVSTKNIAKGFGFGLTYVQKVVELHRGDINLKSRIGIGTEITIKLPLPKTD